MTAITFDGLELIALPGRVMTPRATSEVLVAAASERIEERPARVADIGTGSGALAIAIANACPRAEILATDTSWSAVLLARANANLHRVADRVRVHHGDLLEPLAGRFDVIVANLPYLAASTASGYADLADEPFDAVFAGGDGLEPYRRLVAAAADRLTADGALLIQLDGRLVARSCDELPSLQAALGLPRR